MNFDSNLWGEADENDNLTQALFGHVSVQKKRNKKKSENVSKKDLNEESKTSKEFLKNMKTLERKHHVVRFEVSDDDDDGDDLRKRTKQNLKERKRKKRQQKEIKMQEKDRKKRNLDDDDDELFADIDYDDPVSETVAKKPKLMTTPSQSQENANPTTSKRKQKALNKEKKLEKKRRREEREEEARMNLENSKSKKKKNDSPFVVNTKGISKKKKLQIDSKSQSKKKKKTKEKSKESANDSIDSENKDEQTKGEKTNRSSNVSNGIDKAQKNEKSNKANESINVDGNTDNPEIRNIQTQGRKRNKSGNIVNGDDVVKNTNKTLNNSKTKNSVVEIKSDTTAKKQPSAKNNVKKSSVNETNTPKFSKSSNKETSSHGSNGEKVVTEEENKTKKGVEKKVAKKRIENMDKPEPENKPGKKKKTKSKVVVEQNKNEMEAKKVENKTKKENVTVAVESSHKMSTNKTPNPIVHNKNVSAKSVFNKTKLSDILLKKTNITKAGGQNNVSSKEEKQNKSSVTTKFTALRERMSEQLNEARFRHLNEQLYTQTGPQAFKMFQNDKEAFEVYHKGFQSQVVKWPVNPIDVIIKQVRSMPNSHLIADFGCGSAKLAQSVKNKVHSFDLVPMNDFVTVCDISRVPLANKTIDVVVICLSLMGTNLNDFITEANRVLKIDGVLKIAEVESRISNTQKFIEQIESFGFSLVSKDTSNKMFHMFDFKKTRPATRSTIRNVELAPCLYKKR